MSADVQSSHSTILQLHNSDSGASALEGHDLAEESSIVSVSPESDSFIMLPPHSQPQSLNIPQNIVFSNSSFHMPFSNSEQENLFLFTSDSNFNSNNQLPNSEMKEEKVELSTSTTHTNIRMSSKTIDETKNEKLISEFDNRLDGISPLSAVSSFQDMGRSSPSVSSTGFNRSAQHVLRYQPSGDAMLSAINYTESDMLQEGGFHVPVSSAFNSLEGLLNAGSGTGIQLPDLLDEEVSNEAFMETGSDLQLSPQNFSNNAENFSVNETASLGSIADNSGIDLTLSDDCGKPELSSAGLDKPKIKIRPAKASSPSRPGTQPCPTCGKIFSNSSALTKHKLTHSDERKYICQLCAKAFKRQDHLNGHMLTHRNKKPFECDVEGCGKSYCDARSLRRHKENHHTNSASSVISVSAGSSQVAVIPTIQRLNISGLQPAFPSGIIANSMTSVSTESTSSTRIHYTSAPSVPSQPSPNHCFTQEPSTMAHLLSSVLPTAASQLQFLAFQQQPEHSSLSSQSQEVSLQSTEKKLDVVTSWNSTTIGTNTLMLSHRFGTNEIQKTPGSKDVDVDVDVAVQDVEKEHLLISQHCNEKVSQASPLSDTFIESAVIGRDSVSYHTTSDSVASSSSQISSIAGSDLGDFGATSDNGMFNKGCVSQTLLQSSLQSSGVLLDTNANVGSLQSEAGSSVRQTGTPLLQQLLTPPQTSTPSVRSHSDSVTQQGHTVMQQAFLLSQIQHANQQLLVPQWANVASRLPEASIALANPFVQDPRPVECSLCQRKFKNIPALNGHMRLHGGYFKKENDLKKAEKKLAHLHQPPLQTASMNIRALIEEKIIQRRTNIHAANQIVSDLPLISEGSYTLSIPDNPGMDPVATQNNPQYNQVLQELLENSPSPPLPMLSAGRSIDGLHHEHSELPHGLHREIIELKQQFRIPRPVSDKMRRHSDSDHFIQSQRPCTSYISSALADLLRKKVIAKRTARTCSDPELPVYQMQSLPTTPTYSMSNQNFGQHQESHFSYVERDLLFSAAESKFPTYGTDDNVMDDSVDPIDGIESSFSYEHNSPLINDSDDFNIKTELPDDIEMEKTSPHLDISPSLHMDEPDDDVFLSPTNLPTSPIKNKRKHRPEPLYIPPHVNTCGYTSRLRSPRLWDPNCTEAKNLTPPPYTPPPMLSPLRSGSGLFWHINSYSGNITPKSAPITPSFVLARKSSSNEEWQEEENLSEAPETDILPHVNVGSQYQAKLPRFHSDRSSAMQKDDKADKIWDPSVLDGIPNEDVDMFLEFACCAAVPGGGRNKEFALHVLQLSGGNLEEAILRLMNPNPLISSNSPLVSYQYSETDKWLPSEIEIYHQALIKCDKDFFHIAKECKTKDVKQCIQFYYLWKKVCPEEYKRLRLIRRKREQESIYYNLRSKTPVDLEQEVLDHRLEEVEDNLLDLSQMNKAFLSLSNGPSPGFALNDSLSRASPNERSGSPAVIVKSEQFPENQEIFPCKVCGKVFAKVKSRSAHMKSHRQVDSNRK